MTDYIAEAVPVFFAAILAEAGLARLLKRDVYALDDAIASLSCGVTQQALDVSMKLLTGSLYLMLYQTAHLLQLAEWSWPAWAVAFVGYDVMYYWFHRWSHRVNLVWGAHSPHHQSEEYNFTTALRQGSFETWFSWACYLPLALLGAPPLTFLVVWQLGSIYQFWVHTRLVGRLGPLEKVLITPSHHRVHHAKNPVYIDKNYGAVLVWWDKLFGTFAEEREEPVYGTVHELRSWNPLKANADHWCELWKQMKRTPGWLDKAKLWLKPPGWDAAHPDTQPEIPEVTAANYVKFRPGRPKGLALYALGQFLPVLLGYAAFLERPQWHLPTPTLLASAFVVLSLVVIGGILEAKPWAWPAETLRLVAAAAAVLMVPTVAMPLKVGTVAMVLALLTWLHRTRPARQLA
jgi:sterol desaturase/sphingolipid hydroxylase (fatty acid hydroxylase superfamily)